MEPNSKFKFANKYFRITIHNSNAENIIRNLAELNIITINDEYETLEIFNSYLLDKTVPNLNFVGVKIVELKDLYYIFEMTQYFSNANKKHGKSFGCFQL